MIFVAQRRLIDELAEWLQASVRNATICLLAAD
jgi:hypothetical protein